MAGPGLRTDNDARFTDSTTKPDVKEHQQVHDVLATVANQLGVLQVTKQDGQVLAWDAASQLFVPTTLGGDLGSPVQTSYLTAAPGTVFRIRYAGGWPAVRPSDRPDIYFDLVGAPPGVEPPEWRGPGDNMLSISTRTADDAYALAEGLFARVGAIEDQIEGGIGGGGPVDAGRLQPLVRWLPGSGPGSSSMWEPRNPTDPFGVLFLSTNDPAATPPNDPNLKVGDRWARHPAVASTGQAPDGFNDGF